MSNAIHTFVTLYRTLMLFNVALHFIPYTDHLTIIIMMFI